MPFSLRLASPCDHEAAPTLAALSLQVWLDTYAAAGIRPVLAKYALEEFTEQRFQACLADPEVRLLLAERDGHLLGYARLDLAAICPVAGEEGVELATLYVQRHAAGQGIGSALLVLAEQQARSLTGIGRMWLTVYAGNERARTFYARQGWRDIGSTDFVIDDERHPNRVLAWP
ncbi:MAG TPA: GNAT family N-acetyltransferase [Chitinolyticbacter sp.]|nr:GNAT family N-acetyltransferase [Chitinolyticbacter sp.]